MLNIYGIIYIDRITKHTGRIIEHTYKWLK